MNVETNKSQLIKRVRYFKIEPLKFLLIMYLLVATSIGIHTIAKLLLSNDQTHDYQTDYMNYTIGGRIVNDGNITNLYDYETQKSYYKVLVPSIGEYIRTYRSLPFVAKMLSPISYLSFTNSLKIQVLINIFAYLAVLYLYAKNNRQYLSLIFLSLGFMPIFPAIFNGQVTLMMTAALGLSYLLLCPHDVAKGKYLKRDYPLLAGIIFSLILLKPHFAPLVLFLMLLTKKPGHFLTGFFIGSLTLISVGMRELGIFYIFDYLKFLFTTEDAINGTRYANVSSSQGLFELVLGTQYAFYATIVLSITLLPILYFRYIKKLNKFEPDIKLLIPTIIITTLSLHVFEHDRVLMLIPMAMLWISGKKKLYLLIHIMAYLVFFKFLPLVFLYYLFLGVYLLEYGYEEFERSCNHIAKNWLKI